MHQLASMNVMHQPLAAFGWTLTQATTLAATRQPRALWVLEGSVWITRGDHGDGAVPEDIWLEAGQGLALEPGSAWVIEAWPQARLSLLQAPPLAPETLTPRPWAAAGAALRAGMRRLLQPRAPGLVNGVA